MTCFQVSRNDSHVYFIPGTAGDLSHFASSCGAPRTSCGTLWPRLASAMCGVQDFLNLELHNFYTYICSQSDQTKEAVLPGTAI